MSLNHYNREHPLVAVAGTPLPIPSSYTATTSTLVDSARNLQGYVIGSVVRNDVAKIELKWNYLSTKQWSDILQLFVHSFYNDVTFYDQTKAAWDTRRMYVNDRKAGIVKMNYDTGEPIGYSDCSLHLIEV